ncbi:hypothetical protein EBZ39_08210 [bacterium]|nr:hypothetical protein [bacterium]
MAGAVDLTASMGGGGGSLDPLIAALDRYSSMLERIAHVMTNSAPEKSAPSPVKIEAPEIKIPKIEAPEIKIPKIEAPEVKLNNQESQKTENPLIPSMPIAERKEQSAVAIPSQSDLVRVVSEWGDATVKALINLTNQFNLSFGNLTDKMKESTKPAEQKIENKPNNQSSQNTQQQQKQPKGFGDFTSSLLAAVKGVNVWAYALEKSMAQIGRLVDIALKPIGDFIEMLGEALTPIADIVASLIKMSGATAIVTPIIKVLGKLLQLLAIPFKLLASLVKAFGDVLESAIQPFEIFTDGLILMGDMLESSISALGLFGKSTKTAQNAITDGFEAVKKNIKNVLTDPFNAVPSLIGQIRGAVETLNPAAMIEFDMTMRDLTAVFGTAFVPIVQAATRVLRELAEKLYPIFQRLSPLFEKMTAAIGDTLIQNIERLANAFERLQPAIQAYIESQIYAAERQSLLAEQYYKAENSLSVAGSWFLNWFRTNKDLEKSMNQNNRRAAERPAERRTVGLAAATSPGFKSIADLSRDTLMTAFAATSVAQTREHQDARAREHVAQLPDVIRDAARDAFVAAMREMDQARPVEPRDAVFAREVV